MSNLYEAKKFACLVHLGQRYGNDPYTTHLRDVANRLTDQEDKIVAWLHDVLEDTIADVVEIRERFGEEIAGLVMGLTRGKNESYQTYIERIGKNPRLTRIKIADLTSNFEADGKPHLKERYKKALEYLKSLGPVA